MWVVGFQELNDSEADQQGELKGQAQDDARQSCFAERTSITITFDLKGTQCGSQTNHDWYTQVTSVDCWLVTGM